MAIHKVLLRPDSEPKSYKKEFRKCLMTGGAVVEISEEVTEDVALTLIDKFATDAVPNGVQRLVIKHLKQKFESSPQVQDSLKSLNFSV